MVMTVDDSATMRKIVSIVLKGAGHDIIEAENGEEALNKLPAGKIDFFIVDVNMPVMNGIDFLIRLRAIPDYSKTPVLMLTTESDIETINRGKDAGANDWIVKPFRNEEFLALIQKLTG